MCALIVFALPAIAAENPVSISVFVREDCQHCEDEKAFLSALKEENPSIELSYYDLADRANAELFSQVTERYGLVKGTPLTLVKSTLLQGFSNAETTGREIRRIVTEGTGGNLSFAESLQGGALIGGVGSTCDGENVCKNAPSFFVRVPLVGWVIDVGRYSLTALSLTLGFIDGFNPCAMWVLVMFLIILAQVGSRRRMMQYAGLFILAEVIMYYAILTVWYTAWDFVAMDRIATPLVGILAVGSGVYFLYRYATYKPVCTVTNPEERKKISDRVRLFATKPLTLGVALGILGLAFSVNIFEFACSIGIPQAFTKILELNALSWFGRQWYMFLYILMYMIDDLVVLGVALWSFEKIGATSKYGKWSSFIGGILMLILGILLLFWPSALIF